MADEKTSLKNIIGEKLLNKIQDSYLKYLESSAAIYEINGDYAAGIFSSKYCDFLNQASRKLAGKTDEEALKSGRWICHEDCWATSLKTIKDKKPCEIECSGGIKIYAAPIMANGVVIGSNNAGVSNPPTDEKKIREIAGKYKVDPKELLGIAKEYIPRQEYVINAAKNHILTSAEEISEIFMHKQADEEAVLRKKAEEKAMQAAQEWNKTFDALSDFLFILDKEFKLIKVNKAFADALKAKPEELIGKKCHNLLHKLDKPWPICPSAQTFNDKKPHTEEIVDSNIGIPLLVSASPVFNDEGEVIAVVHYAKDITERKKMEDELRLQAVIFNNIGEGVCLVRASDAVIVYANSKFEKMFGYGPGELNGKPVSIVNYSDEKKSARQVSQEIIDELTEKGNAVYEVHNVKKDGTPFWCRAAVSTFDHSAFGKVWVAVQGDITAEKQASEQLNSFYAELKNTVSEKTKELRKKIEELERFRKATIEREFRIKELNDEIERLKAGKP